MRPLNGILVVSLEQAVAAPLCTARLAEAGARVIKVEREGGDFARGYDTAAGGESSYFVWTNQGKESVVLDFKNKRDADLLRAMIGRADVLVQNLKPGALQRAGLSIADLRDSNPRLITCEISGYGSAPELSGMKAYDLLVQAESGLISLSGGLGEPGRIGVSICDIGAGMAAHAAIVEALFLRSQTGKCSEIAISLFDVTAEWMTVPLAHALYGTGAPQRCGLHHPSIAPYGSYATGDGQQTIISIQNEREWEVLCKRVLNRDDMVRDPRYASNNSRVANRESLDSDIISAIAPLDGVAFRAMLRDADIAYGALNTVDDLKSHPALRFRDYAASNGAVVALPTPPVSWSPTETASMVGAPAIGSATEAVRAEFARPISKGTNH